METTAAPKRSKRDGRYTFSDMEKVCGCGHTLGVHTADAPHECLECDCETFRPARKGR